MAMTKCAECGSQVSTQAKACPSCGAPPKKKSSSVGVLLLIFVACLGALGLFGAPSETSSRAVASPAFGATAALGLCRETIKLYTKDPEKADIPYVPNMGSGSEFYFAWGNSTKYTRMRNGLGLEVPVAASCTVDANTRKITSLSIDSKTVI